MKAIKASIWTALIVFALASLFYGVEFYPHATATIMIAIAACSMVALIWCAIYFGGALD